LGTTIIIPGVVAHFMTGAAAGVIGNGAGGRRGAILGAFSNGLLITFLPLFLLPVLGDMGLSNATFSDSDYGVVGLFLGGLSSVGGQIALVVGIILSVVLLYVLTFLKRKQKVVETAEAATATK
jgi:PTS system ascorbate-specific IIC component